MLTKKKFRKVMVNYTDNKKYNKNLDEIFGKYLKN